MRFIKRQQSHAYYALLRIRFMRVSVGLVCDHT